MKMEMLKRLFEDDQYIERYIQVFKIETPKMIQSIFNSLENEDYENVSIVAHGLKSQLTYLENEEAYKVAVEMELIADSANVNKQEELQTRAKALEKILTQILTEL